MDQSCSRHGRKMGVTTNLPKIPSICLGTIDMSVKEITGAYSTFVNKGVYTEPIFISKITDKNGVIIEEFFQKQTKLLSEKTLAIMVKMLQGAVDGVFDKEYQERVVKLNKKNTSGVRGTIDIYDIHMVLRLKWEERRATQNFSDGWFVGITPNLVTSVWTGCEDRSAHFRGADGYDGNTAQLCLDSL